MHLVSHCILINFVSTQWPDYCKQGKIHWAKHSWFQPCKVFTEIFSGALASRVYYLTLAKYFFCGKTFAVHLKTMKTMKIQPSKSFPCLQYFVGRKVFIDRFNYSLHANRSASTERQVPYCLELRPVSYKCLVSFSGWGKQQYNKNKCRVSNQRRVFCGSTIIIISKLAY